MDENASGHVPVADATAPAPAPASTAAATPTNASTVAASTSVDRAVPPVGVGTIISPAERLHIMVQLADGIHRLTRVCHHQSREMGWWDGTALDPNHTAPIDAQLTWPYVVGTKLALIHSEISEALEGHRKGLMDDHLPHRTMIEVELADALIRIGDLAGALGLDLGGAVVEKLAYNQNRPDHRRDVRAAEGGKKV